MTITKLDNNTIKIVTPANAEKTVTIVQLLEQKRLLQERLARYDAQIVLDRHALLEKIADVDEIISQAQALGIILP